MSVMHSCEIHPSHPGSMRKQRHELSPQRDKNPPSGHFSKQKVKAANEKNTFEQKQTNKIGRKA